MFYFPIFEGNFPTWLPYIGGNNFKFFNAIFNVADMAISTGVGILIVFNKKHFINEISIKRYKFYEVLYNNLILYHFHKHLQSHFRLQKRTNLF